MYKICILSFVIFSCVVFNFFILEAMEDSVDKVVRLLLKQITNEKLLDHQQKKTSDEMYNNSIGFRFNKRYDSSHANIGIVITDQIEYWQTLNLDLPKSKIFFYCFPIQFGTFDDLKEKLRKAINNGINEINQIYNNRKCQIFNENKLPQEIPYSDIPNLESTEEDQDDLQKIPYSDIPDLDNSIEEEIK